MTTPIAPEVVNAPLTPPEPANSPFSDANLQARIDAFMNKTPAPMPGESPAPAAAGPASGTPVASDTSVVTEDAGQPGTPDGGTPVENGQPTDQSATEQSEAPATDPELPKGFLVDLPPRRPGETPTQIEVSDEQTAEALKRMSNGFMYATEAKAKIAEADEKIAMVNDFEVMVQADPLSIFDNMAGDAKLNIARAMLAENFEALAPEIELWWRDDSERKLFRASNIETRNTARQNFQQKRAWDIEVRKTGQALAALVPEGTPKEVSDEFLIAAGNYLGSIADSRKSRLVSADEVPHLLAHWIKRFGFDAPGTGAPAQNANPPAPTNAAPPVAPAAPVPTAATVAKAQAVITARAAAKATTTVGAGASPVTATNRPPKGLTIEQAADWAMQNLRARSQ